MRTVGWLGAAASRCPAVSPHAFARRAPPGRCARGRPGATGWNGLSLIDLAPSGPIASEVRMKCASVRGTSAYAGSR